jgi:DegV family protein with EDD domain
VAPRVAVVTDSTASLPAELAAKWHIATVHMQLRIGDELTDEMYVRSDHLLRAMAAEVPITSEPPELDAFFWNYQDAWGRGADAIVSVHLSERLSPVAQVARAAASRVRIPVHIVDAQSSGMTLGFAALAAAQAAAAGASPAEVREAAERRARDTKVLIYVDTLEYLRRGKRIGAAAAMFGTALSVKPLLTVNNGEVEPIDKVLGSERAVSKVVSRTVQMAGGRPVDIAVEHFAAPERGEELLAELRRRVPGGREFVLSQVSGAIGANVGPGALAVTISPF